LPYTSVSKQEDKDTILIAADFGSIKEPLSLRVLLFWIFGRTSGTGFSPVFPTPAITKQKTATTREDFWQQKRG
jgi:hypothetical protein